MVKIRSLMTRQPSDAVDSTASVAEREQEFLESTSPDAQSVVSHWFDAQSEGEQSFTKPANHVWLRENSCCKLCARSSCKQWRFPGGSN